MTKHKLDYQKLWEQLTDPKTKAEALLTIIQSAASKLILHGEREDIIQDCWIHISQKTDIDYSTKACVYFISQKAKDYCRNRYRNATKETATDQIDAPYVQAYDEPVLKPAYPWRSSGDPVKELDKFIKKLKAYVCGAEEQDAAKAGIMHLQAFRYHLTGKYLPLRYLDTIWKTDRCFNRPKE
jgi:hypothetical protein